LFPAVGYDTQDLHQDHRILVWPQFDPKYLLEVHQQMDAAWAHIPCGCQLAKDPVSVGMNGSA
jgi:hypothetical protein